MQNVITKYSLFHNRDSKVPEPPPGTKWKEVRHDNKVTWLVSWTENIQGSIKYIMLNPSSRIKVGTIAGTCTMTFFVSSQSWNDAVWSSGLLKTFLTLLCCLLHWNVKIETFQEQILLFYLFFLKSDTTYSCPVEKPNLIGCHINQIGHACLCRPLPNLLLLSHLFTCRERRIGRSMKRHVDWRNVWTASEPSTAKTGSPRRWGSDRGLWLSISLIRWGPVTAICIIEWVHFEGFMV